MKNVVVLLILLSAASLPGLCYDRGTYIGLFVSCLVYICCTCVMCPTAVYLSLNGASQALAAAGALGGVEFCKMISVIHIHSIL